MAEPVESRGNLIDDIRRHWAGKGTLRRAYWGYGVVGSLILYVLALIPVFMVIPSVLETGDLSPLESPLFETYLAVVSLVLAAYQVFASVVIWRNSSNVQNRVWGEIAKIVVIIGLVVLVYQVATQF